MDKGASLVKFAMHYGVWLGLFWVFKYLFLIGSGFSDHVFIYIYHLLNIGTFLLIYIFYYKYQETDKDKPKGLGQCIIFIVSTCFFASFFEGAIMYAHFKFIDPGFFVRLIHPYIVMIGKLPETSPEIGQLKKTYIAIFESRGIYILANFIRNITVGVFIALFVGLFTKHLKTK